MYTCTLQGLLVESKDWSERTASCVLHTTHCVKLSAGSLQHTSSVIYKQFATNPPSSPISICNISYDDEYLLSVFSRVSHYLQLTHSHSHTVSSPKTADFHPAGDLQLLRHSESFPLMSLNLVAVGACQDLCSLIGCRLEDLKLPLLVSVRTTVLEWLYHDDSTMIVPW